MITQERLAFLRLYAPRDNYNLSSAEWQAGVQDLLSHIAFLTEPVDGEEIARFEEAFGSVTWSNGRLLSLLRESISLVRRLQSTINQQRAENERLAHKAVNAEIDEVFAGVYREEAMEEVAEAVRTMHAALTQIAAAGLGEWSSIAQRALIQTQKERT